MAEWKKIDGFPNYSVSDDGDVRNDKTGRILKANPNSNGYYQVALFTNGERKMKLVHVLVALAFVPNPNHKPEVNHKDGKKPNCKASNLEWCTASENCLHRCRVLGFQPNRGQFEAYYEAIRKRVVCIETGIVYPSVSAAAKAVNRTKSNISKVLNGRMSTCAGLHWGYAQ